MLAEDPRPIKPKDIIPQINSECEAIVVMEYGGLGKGNSFRMSSITNLELGLLINQLTAHYYRSLETSIDEQ